MRRADAANPNAPSVSLPLRFVFTGLAALFTGVVWLIWRPDILASYHYNQHTIAVTHLFTLGWITSIIMGAMYQLVPVALETKLYSERLARWQYLAHLAGFIGMVAMFSIWNMKQVGHFGSVLGFGIILFVFNLGRTLARTRRWNVVAFSIAASLFWLFMTLLAGLYLAADKCWLWSRFSPISQMHAHVHLGALGFFVMMLVGVSYKLVPMFALSELQNPRRAAWSIGLLNAGLAGCFATILTGSPWKLAFAFVVTAGLALYGWELRAILRARKRRALDWGLRYFLTAIGTLAPVSILGLILAWPGLPLTALTGQLENVYGFLGFIGVVSMAILGMLYKIIPFLVWYGSYSQEIGRSKVPALADLYSQRVQAAGYWTFLGSVAAGSVFIALGDAPAVRWSCLLWAASLLLFAANMAQILAHLIRPRIEPLTLRPAQGAHL